MKRSLETKIKVTHRSNRSSGWREMFWWVVWEERHDNLAGTFFCMYEIPCDTFDDATELVRDVLRELRP